MANKRWQFWRRRSADPDSADPNSAKTTPEIDTKTVPPDKQPRSKQPSNKQPGTQWWRFGRLKASDTPPPTEAVTSQHATSQHIAGEDIADEGITDEDVADTAPVSTRRWWQRSRAAVPEQTEPRPLNPDGTLPPDLLEQFESEHNTNRAMRSYLKRFLKRVEEAEQQGNIDNVIQGVDNKLSGMERGKLTDVWEKVQTLGKLMRDPAAHWQSKAVAVASLVYVVSPLDAIPDVIPGLGLTDDVAVVVAVVSYLGNALNRYAQTELKDQLEDHSDREIKKHLLKNRISLLYAAAAAAFVLVVALLLQYFQG